MVERSLLCSPECMIRIELIELGGERMLGVWLSMHASTASHHSIQHHHKTGQSNHSVQVQSAELNRPTKIDIDLCVSTVVADDLFQALFSPFLAGGDAFCHCGWWNSTACVAGMHVLGEGWDWGLILNDVVCREQTVHDDMNS